MLYKGFNDLSKAGASTAGGLEDVRDTAHQLGYSMREMDGFVNLIASNAKNIKMFGATVGEGGKAFAKVAHELWYGDFGKGLQSLGIQLEEQRESALAYMTIMGRSGQLTKMNDQMLVKGTAEFVKELDLAATLTGTTRKQQEEARLNAQADAQFRAAMRVAVREKDEEKIAKLKSAETMAGMVSEFDKTGAAGILREAAGGMAAGPEAIKAAFMYGSDKLKGGENPEQLAKLISSSVAENQETFDEINKYRTDLSVQSDIVGAANLKQNIDSSLEEAKKLGISFEKYKADQKPKETGAITKMNEVDRMQRETAINLDKVVNTFSGATDKYKTVAGLLEDSSKALLSAAKFINREPTTGAKMKQSTAAASPPSATNEVKSGRIGKNEAAAVLENGSKRDIEAFGGREALEKIVKGASSGASSKTAPTPVPTPAPATGPTPSSNSTSTQSGSTISGMASDLSKLFSFGPKSGSEDNFKKLDPSFKEKVIAAATEYNNLTGKKLTVNSAWRSREDQERLYNNKKPGQTVAKPGTSRHEQGLAVDIQESSDPVLQKIMNELGVTHGYGNGKKNVTHFQARNGGIFKGPTTGYNVELHGEEAVVPMNGGKNVTKQALPMGMGNDDRSGEMISLLQMLIGQNETVISLLDNGNDYTKKLVSVMS